MSVTLDRRGFIAHSAAVTSALFGQAAFTQNDLTRLSIAQAARLIRSRELSPVDITESYLRRIGRIDDRINAYITLTDELALAQARELEAELARGLWRGPLHGIPIALKDNIDTAGIRTTAASAVLADRVPNRDAEVVRRLKAAGAVILGKLNLHEFAYGGTSAITHFGPVHNPWNLEHIPGGSSGGSAAAVAARLCAAALGTDTLASIRQPAAYCSVSGFKATHGLASIRGIIPISETLDHVGPLARSAADCALVLAAIAGYDAADPVSIDAPALTYADAVFAQTRNLRLGILGTPFFDNLDTDIASAVEAALTVLRALTGSAREVMLPAVPDFPPLLAEGYAYHEQYLRDTDNHRLYDPVTLERLLAAGQTSAAQYIRARRELDIARHGISAVFRDVDVLVSPTTPGLPERIDQAENPADAAGAESSVRNTAPFNILGIPAISIPCGFSRSGLPIGLQVCGPHLRENDVLALAHAYQQSTDWHEREPSIA